MKYTVEVVDPLTEKRKELFSYLAMDERQERIRNKYLGPRRQMYHFELSVELRHLERWGVQVPTLMFSNNMPHYIETTEDGVELYNHGGRTVEVRAGEVIDFHGNVVNLQALQEQFFVAPFLSPTTKKRTLT